MTTPELGDPVAIYRFIAFYERNKSWICRNKTSLDIVGYVDWYHPWKQYVFTGIGNAAIFSHDCLADIQDFLKKQNLKGNP